LREVALLGRRSVSPATSEVRPIRNTIFLTIAFFALGCSSHSAAPVVSASPSPHHNGAGSWAYVNAPYDSEGGGNGVIHWIGDQMTALGDVSVAMYIPGGDYIPWKLPHPIAQTMTVGPDGNLWVGELEYVDSITPGDHVTEYKLPRPGEELYAIVPGSDGALWYTEGSINFGRITTSGQTSEFTPPEAMGGMVLGPDGNLWALAIWSNHVYRINMGGAMKAYTLPTTGYYITNGPDGAMWFQGSTAQNQGTYLGRIATDGSVSTFPTGENAEGIRGITLGPDGLLWLLTQQSNNQEALETFDPVTHTFSPPIPLDLAAFQPSNYPYMQFAPGGALWIDGVKRIGVYFPGDIGQAFSR
jgi:streptogramin lyase